jgi:hypothetical protein
MVGMAWLLVIWFLILMLVEPPGGRPAYVAHLMLILLLTWCHPYTLVGIPVAWLAMLFFPCRKRLVTALSVTFALTGMLAFLNPGESDLTLFTNPGKTI